MKYLTGLFLLLMLCAFTESGSACVCSGTPTACESHQSADGVFVGYVERTVGENYFGSFNTGYVRVEQVFKGKVPKNVKFNWGYTSCDVFLESGSRWLFYARKVDKKGEVWDIQGCGGSHELKLNSADGDLKYLNNLSQNVGKTRLSGNYSYQSGASISRAPIEMQGAGQKYDLVTDENGFFELYGLPVGIYYLKPKLPEGARLRGVFTSGDGRFPPPSNAKAPAAYDESSSVKVELAQEERCVEANISVETGNSIGGRVVNYEGKPLTGICVNLLEAGENARSQTIDCVNDNGDFLIYGFPPGRYALGLLKENVNSVNYDPKFPPVFYPGVLKKEEGKIFEIGNDDQFGDIEIRLPKDHPLKLFEGTLFYADGTTVDQETVTFTYRQGLQQKVIERRTDQQGRFSLPVLAGLKGYLKGRAQVFEYAAEDCPRLRKYVSGNAFWEYADTKRIPLQVKTNMNNLKLKLPFTPCLKADDNTN